MQKKQNKKIRFVPIRDSEYEKLVLIVRKEVLREVIKTISTTPLPHHYGDTSRHSPRVY